MKIVDKKAFEKAAFEAWNQACDEKVALIARQKRELKNFQQYVDLMRKNWLEAVKEAHPDLLKELPTDVDDSEEI
jgi:hypothetical protein